VPKWVTGPERNWIWSTERPWQAGLRFAPTSKVAAVGRLMKTLDIEHPAGLVRDDRLAAGTVVLLVRRDGSVNEKPHPPPTELLVTLTL